MPLFVHVKQKNVRIENEKENYHKILIILTQGLILGQRAILKKFSWEGFNTWKNPSFLKMLFFVQAIVIFGDFLLTTCLYY